MMRPKVFSSLPWTSLLVKRSYKTNQIRVRFAPSPTGYLHLGGLRTALYNYLFALSKNGKMILRIEDTDQSRKIDGAMEALIENLEWCGIMCHEGPTQGGNHGPYIQSERCNIYQEHVKKLIENKSAYPCFCTERRLDLLRRDALRNRQLPKYDNKCRHLSSDVVKDKLNKGDQHCIRFKLSSDCMTFDDLVFGPIAYDVSLVEGDPVIMKSDGFPTYHFANVVDDHLMEVSHVLRGVEWQISTTKHILLYKAFGWTPPQFGHLPLITNADGTKLSKRQGDIKVEDYRNKGILPNALLNYITHSGGGFPRIPGEGMAANTVEELASQFELSFVNANPSRLNPDLLSECNRLELMEQLKDDVQTEILVKEAQRLITEHLKDKVLYCPTDYIRQVLRWSSGRLTNLKDLVSDSLAFLWILPLNGGSLEADDVELLKKLLVKLDSVDVGQFEMCFLKDTLREFSKTNNTSFSTFMKTLRSILSGLKEGPGVAEMMEVLGKDMTMERINTALECDTKTRRNVN